MNGGRFWAALLAVACNQPPEGSGATPPPPGGGGPAPAQPPAGGGAEGAEKKPAPQGGAEKGRPSGEEPGATGIPVIIKVERAPEGVEKPQQEQDAIRAGAHVTFRGNVGCSDCSGSFVLRATLPPGEEGKPASLVTTLDIAETGPFELLVPKGKDALVLELLDDANGNGRPDVGERMLVLPPGEGTVPDQDRSDIFLNFDMAQSANQRLPIEQPPPEGEPPGEGGGPAQQPGGEGTPPAPGAQGTPPAPGAQGTPPVPGSQGAPGGGH